MLDSLLHTQFRRGLMTLRLKSIYHNLISMPRDAAFKVDLPLRLCTFRDQISACEITRQGEKNVRLIENDLYCVLDTLCMSALYTLQWRFQRRWSAKNNATPESFTSGCLLHVMRTSVCPSSRNNASSPWPRK